MRRIREQVLARDPYCTIRGPKCKRVSTTVDHIVPLSVAPHLAHDLANLRGACSACNYAGGARITNGQRSGRVYAGHRLAPYYPISHPIVEACPWSKSDPDRLCMSQCRSFPIPSGCRLQSRLAW